MTLQLKINELEGKYAPTSFLFSLMANCNCYPVTPIEPPPAPPAPEFCYPDIPDCITPDPCLWGSYANHNLFIDLTDSDGTNTISIDNTWAAGIKGSWEGTDNILVNNSHAVVVESFYGDNHTSFNNVDLGSSESLGGNSQYSITGSSDIQIQDYAGDTEETNVAYIGNSNNVLTYFEGDENSLGVSGGNDQLHTLVSSTSNIIGISNAHDVFVNASSDGANYVSFSDASNLEISVDAPENTVVGEDFNNVVIDGSYWGDDQIGLTGGSEAWVNLGAGNNDFIGTNVDTVVVSAVGTPDNVNNIAFSNATNTWTFINGIDDDTNYMVNNGVHNYFSSTGQITDNVFLNNVTDNFVNVAGGTNTVLAYNATDLTIVAGEESTNTIFVGIPADDTSGDDAPAADELPIAES